ncbi:hypothetical protein UlMin_041549, partial [Ulmus minor]
IDTDKLLKKDLVTLDEAVKTANNAVLLAITAVSALKSDMHRKLIGASRNDVKEINILEAFNILERYKEAKIGFGAGYSFKTSILQSIYDCPFLSMGVKDLDGMIICIVASSGVINDDDVDKFVHTFRQTTEYTKEIVVSTIFEPTLEPNLLVTTVLTVGFTGEQASQKSGILIRLAQRFPFISRLWGISNLQSSETQGNNLLVKSTSEVIDSKKETGDRNSVGIIAEVSEKYPGNVQPKMNSNFNESHASSESEESEAGSFDGIFESNLHNHITKETPFQREPQKEPQREPLDSWNEGLGYQIAQKWAKERASEAGATQMLDKLGIFRLPVGVRSSEELKDGINISSPTQHSKPKAEDVLKSKRMINKSTTSSNEPTDTGLEVVRDFYNATSALLKGKYTDPPKGRGRVSVRAASMLEAERDSPKKWNPTVEMKYRGGIYRGRCQGGLPEGKGRLVLGDGSIYDGMWRYGKKSGLGTFYFSNGNVFRGSWRDDVMHGKGWFYFHTGDRWFANFWKGKANGEGRFYSKSGDVIFGQFQEGWRHGEFICIDVDGR